MKVAAQSREVHQRDMTSIPRSMSPLAAGYMVNRNVHPGAIPGGEKTGLKNTFNLPVIISLFTKLSWPADSEMIFGSSSQATTCLLYGGGFTLSLLI